MSEPRRVLLASSDGEVHCDLATIAYVRFESTTAETRAAIHIACRSGDWFKVEDTPENRKALVPVLVSNEQIIERASVGHEHEWSCIVKNGFKECRMFGCDAKLMVPPQ